MEIILKVVHLFAAMGVIGLVLMQHGKGADMGAAFGSGASGSLFGVTGSTNFLSRATAICVTIFFAASLGLAHLSSQHKAPTSVVSVQKKADVPVVPPSAVPAPVQKPVDTTSAKDVPQ